MPRIEEVYMCCRCHKKFNSVDFYKTHSTIYTDAPYMPICKDCFFDVYNMYCRKYNDKKKAMQRVCMAFDLYWDEDIFDRNCIGGDLIMGNYMKSLNMKQYRGKTFESNIDQNFVFGENKSSVAITRQNAEPEDIEMKNENQVKASDVERWGSGFSSNEYKELNAHYKYLKVANPNCDSNQEIFIINLCEIKMKQAHALKDDDIDAYTKLTELYRKIFQQAGLKTVKEATTSAEDCWSSWTGVISKTTPEEYYKNKELYRDMDGFDDYMTRHFLRPLNNLVNGTENRDSEFFIGDGADDE